VTRLEENPLTLAAGTKLGRYEIRSKIGEGGMGEVYLAQATKLPRRVVLKTLPVEVATNQDRVRYLMQGKPSCIEIQCAWPRVRQLTLVRDIVLRRV
jgi:serine/threonine protein kinase